MSDQQIRIISGPTEAINLFWDKLTDLEEKIMALTAAQEAAFTEVMDGLGQLGTTVNDVFNAITNGQVQLRSKISELEQVRDTLIEEDVAEDSATAEQIAALNKIISDLQSTATANETEVVDRLRSLSSKVKAQTDQIATLDD